MLSSLQNTVHLRPVIRVECGQRKSFSLYYIRQKKKKIKVWHHSHRQIDFNVIVYWKQCINCLLLSRTHNDLCGYALKACREQLLCLVIHYCGRKCVTSLVDVVAYLLSMRLFRVLHLLHLSITSYPLAVSHYFVLSYLTAIIW
jgi:hypothetical protein